MLLLLYFFFKNAYDYCRSQIVHWTAMLSIIKAEVKTEKQAFKFENRSHYVWLLEGLSSFWTINFTREMFSATSSGHRSITKDSSTNNEVQHSISWQSKREKAMKTTVLKEFQNWSLKIHQYHKWVTLPWLKSTMGEVCFFSSRGPTAEESQMRTGILKILL